MAVVKKGLTVLLDVRVPFTLTDVVFMMLRGIRGGSMAVGMGSQYAVEKGSMDLMLESRSVSKCFTKECIQTYQESPPFDKESSSRWYSASSYPPSTNP